MLCYLLFFLMIRPPPRSTRTDTLFPYTTLCRSYTGVADGEVMTGPFNPTSGKPYRGINRIWLDMQGHEDPRWLTYDQATAAGAQVRKGERRSEEHTSELQSLMRISYAVFCLKKKRRQ